MVSACANSSSGVWGSVGNSSPGGAHESNVCKWCKHVPKDASSCPQDSISLEIKYQRYYFPILEFL